jgi:hypothetical protein
MSKTPEISDKRNDEQPYDPFTPDFYERFANEPEIIARIPAVKTHVNTILGNLGVRHPDELSHDMQRRIKKESVIRISLDEVL